MYIRNASQCIDFCMVTTAGLADSTSVLGLGANRLIDNSVLASCTGNLINKTQGAYTLVMSSADCNGGTIGLHFTAPGDVPLHLTFPTTAGGLGSSIVADAVWRAIIASYSAAGNAAEAQLRLDSTVSSRMGATPLINNLERLDSTVSSRMGTFSLPLLFSALSINASGQVTAASVAAGGIASTSFTAAALNAIADAMLDRNMATGVDSGTESVRTPRQALRVSRNKVDTTVGIVYKEDDTTTSFTFTVTTAAGNPITIFDPADA